MCVIFGTPLATPSNSNSSQIQDGPDQKSWTLPPMPHATPAKTIRSSCPCLGGNIDDVRRCESWWPVVLVGELTSQPHRAVQDQLPIQPLVDPRSLFSCGHVHPQPLVAIHKVAHHTTTVCNPAQNVVQSLANHGLVPVAKDREDTSAPAGTRKRWWEMHRCWRRHGRLGQPPWRYDTVVEGRRWCWRRWWAWRLQRRCWARWFGRFRLVVRRGSWRFL